MGPKLGRVPSFFVLLCTTWNGRLLLVFTMALFGNKSVHRTLGSIEFFLLQSNKSVHRTLDSIEFSLLQSGEPDLSPMKNYNVRWGPNFQKSPSSSIPMFYNFQRKLTCCLDTRMRHQNRRLDILLSSSGQHCVDLSPMENFIFRWGPNCIIESPSSVVHMFQTF